MTSRTSSTSLAATIGALAAIAVAGVLVPARDAIDNTNVALILVIVIVGAAALGGRIAGIVTSITAALAFNFFHTEPLYSLHVDAADDVWTVVLLFVVGLIVGELALLGRSSRVRAQKQREGAHRLEDIAASLATGRSADELWPEVRDALIGELHLADATLDMGPVADGLVEIGRHGGFTVSEMHWAEGGMELPRAGAQVPVRAGHRTLGRIVLVPTQGRGTSLDERRVAVALADHLAVAIERDGIRPRPTT